MHHESLSKVRRKLLLWIISSEMVVISSPERFEYASIATLSAIFGLIPSRLLYLVSAYVCMCLPHLCMELLYILQCPEYRPVVK